MTRPLSKVRLVPKANAVFRPSIIIYFCLRTENSHLIFLINLNFLLNLTFICFTYFAFRRRHIKKKILRLTCYFYAFRP